MPPAEFDAVILAAPSQVAARAAGRRSMPNWPPTWGDRAFRHGNRLVGLRPPADRPSAGRHGRRGAGGREQPDPGLQLQQPEISAPGRRRARRCCGCSSAGRGGRSWPRCPTSTLPAGPGAPAAPVADPRRAGLLRRGPLAADHAAIPRGPPGAASPGSRPALARFPGLQLAGNAYHGVGIPDCIHSGESAAERILAPAG